MSKQLLVASLAVLACTSTANARDRHHDEQPRTYLGAGFAEFSVDDEDFGYEADDNGLKLLAGYEFNDYFAVEVGYLGGAKIVDEGLFDTEEVDLRAISGSLVGRLPLTSTVSMFGKLGVARYEADFRWSIDGDVIDADRFRDNEMTYGVGLVLQPSSRFEIRGEYEAIEDAFDVMSVSGVFRF